MLKLVDYLPVQTHKPYNNLHFITTLPPSFDLSSMLFIKFDKGNFKLYSIFQIESNCMLRCTLTSENREV